MAGPFCASLLYHVVLLFVLCDTSFYLPSEGDAKFDIFWIYPESGSLSAQMAQASSTPPAESSAGEGSQEQPDELGEEPDSAPPEPPPPPAPEEITEAVFNAPDLERMVQLRKAALEEERRKLEQVERARLETIAILKAAEERARLARLQQEAKLERLRVAQAAEQARRELLAREAERETAERERSQKQERQQAVETERARLERMEQEKLKREEEDNGRLIAEKEHQAAVQRETERQRAAEQQRLTRETKERTRIAALVQRLQQEEAERRTLAEQERVAKEAEERERVAAERERLEKIRQEAERRTLAEQERLRREAEERARLAAERERLERIQREAERQRIAQEERLRREAEQRARMAEERARLEGMQREAARQRVAEQEKVRRETEERSRMAENERREKMAREAERQRVARQRAEEEKRRLDTAQRARPEHASTDIAKKPGAPATGVGQPAHPRHNGGAAVAKGAAAVPSASVAQKETAKAPQEKREKRGVVVPTVYGDLKLVVKADEELGIMVTFREYPKENRKRPQSRSDALRAQKVLPVVLKKEEGVREAVIETAREGVYVFAVEAGRGKPAVGKFTMKLFELNNRKMTRDLGSRKFSGKTVVVKVLMPEGIFWDDESAFTGSMEDSESVTKFNSDTGLYWKEYYEQ